MRGRKIQTPCKRRTKRACTRAKRSCSYATGKVRKYCRTRKNQRK